MSLTLAFFLATSLAAPAPVTKGKEIFAAKCAVCHDADGRAQGPYGKQHAIPDFTSKAFQAKQSEKTLIAIVTDGEQEADMPAFGSQLSADDIKAVAAYIQKLGPGPKTK